MDSSFHDDIVELLDRSGIPVSDRELWLGILDEQSDVVQVLFLKIFYGHEEMLFAMTDNLRLKIALQNDSSKVQEVFDQEKRMFSEMLGVSHNPVQAQEV